jgi:hypothetical protein
MKVLKLKPIAEQIIQEAGTLNVTWGEVRDLFLQIQQENKNRNWKIVLSTLKNVFNSEAAPDAIQSIAGILNDYTSLESWTELSKAVVEIASKISRAELANPFAFKISQFKGPLWDKLKLSQEISQILDDKIEKEFIEKELIPTLSRPGTENTPFPNMDELLGKWLNDKKN